MIYAAGYHQKKGYGNDKSNNRVFCRGFYGRVEPYFLNRALAGAWRHRAIAEPRRKRGSVRFGTLQSTAAFDSGVKAAFTALLRVIGKIGPAGLAKHRFTYGNLTLAVYTAQSG
jgi:hypothetical protein